MSIAEYIIIIVLLIICINFMFPNYGNFSDINIFDTQPSGIGTYNLSTIEPVMLQLT